MGATDDAMAPSYCDTLSLPSRPFASGPYGQNRGDVAGDFTLPLVDGTSWSFQSSFTGCESYIFVPDTLKVSDLDPSSIWGHDLDRLVKASPKNVHYFFVSLSQDDATAGTNTTAMQGRVDALVGGLSPADADHWKQHLHVVAMRAGSLGNWVGQVIHSRFSGIAIDRAQRLRDVGMLADVSRFDQALSSAMKWPWQSNLAYAANEAIYMNAQADDRARLDAENATVVDLWKGEVLSEFAETDVDLPPAQEMAGFDTLEVEVTMACPSPSAQEFSSCGAWDYLASLSVREGAVGGDAGAGTNVELARFITSYHREVHWVVDVSAMLAKLRDGGTRHFRWDFAPPWNKQPAATKLSLRFSNQKKGYAPLAMTPLFTGGTFDDHYNDSRVPVTVPIPADAKRVELWSLVTGHGSDPLNQCSEFCDHQHELTVNGTKYLHDFPMAGSDSGCIAEQSHGMVPNQGGTWWFGRGGWCPGEQVKPWIVDLTANVTPGGNATVSYRGLLNNATPPSVAMNPGNIVLTSYLVVYR